MSHRRNLVLAGFMGTGKSTVGRLLADRLKMAFVDTDAEVETAAGRTITQIFAEQGEAAFRQIEAAVCRRIAAGYSQVIAAGGGALLNPETRAVFEASGLIVCLNADLDTIRQRIAQDPARPLSSQIETLYRRRAAHYAGLPYHAETGGKSPDDLAQEIVRLWHNRS